METLPTRIFTVQTQKGSLGLEIFATPLCLDITRSIIEGRTYPPVSLIQDVRVVVDVGANVGAASCFFALLYPAAQVLAFEPFAPACQLLRRNLAPFSQARVFQVGLADRDGRVPLFVSREDPATNSVGSSYLNGAQSVPIDLHHAGNFLQQLGVPAIDVLKIDTEGCELPVLHALGSLLATVKVLYLEYHDEADRRAIDLLLQRTHVLVAARIRHPHRGELCYVGTHAVPDPAALDRFRIPSTALAGPVPAGQVEAVETVGAAGRPGQFAVAVVMPTILRPSLLRAVQSVFGQRLQGPGQLLLGVDQVSGDRTILEEVRSLTPPGWTLTVFDPGYSTSVRHGGLHAARDGGALRTILSYAAHSRYVAYLDDDNWWDPEHLTSLLSAIAGHDWAFSRRWFVDAETLQPLCEDSWESVGPDQGMFVERFGGFVDPNTLLVDKLVCESVLSWWSVPLAGDSKGMSADRNVFRELRQRFRGIGTQRATCFYRMDPQDNLHPARLERIRQIGAIATTAE